jgi:hypothetical protein
MHKLATEKTDTSKRVTFDAHVRLPAPSDCKWSMVTVLFQAAHRFDQLGRPTEVRHCSTHSNLFIDALPAQKAEVYPQMGVIRFA